MTKDKTSGNTNMYKLERKTSMARLAEMTNKVYPGNTGKTEPEKNAFVL